MFNVKYLQKAQPQAYNFIKKETSTQVLSWEFYETFKNNFFHRTPQMAASAASIHLLKINNGNTWKLLTLLTY